MLYHNMKISNIERGACSLKLMGRIFFVLLIINAALLYVHYSNSAVADGYDKNALTYSQEIEVQYDGKQFIVTHHFTNLAPLDYDIEWPKGSSDIACVESEITQCTRSDEQLSKIVAGEATEQTYRYTLPKPEAVQGVFEVGQPFAKIANAAPQLTTVHIVDETTSGGMWVTGLEQIGTHQLEDFHYFLFAGVGEVTDLFWQQEVTPLAHRGERFTLFDRAVTDEEFGEHIDELLTQFKSKHMTVVLHQGNHNIEANRYVALPESEKENIANVLFTKSVQTAYGIPLEERKIAELVGSILLEQPIGTPPANAAYGKLTETLAADDLVRLENALREPQEEPLTAERFDQLVGSASHSEVNYFSEMLAGQTPEHLLLYEPKEVVHGEKVLEGVQPIKMKGQLYYPLRPLLAAFDYEVTSDEQSIHVKSEDETFRFSLIDSFYVYQQKRVNLRQSPYMLINGQYYFEEQSLLRIFKLIFEHHEDEIQVSSLRAVIEEAVEDEEEGSAKS